jgi:ech hydrogenase subunit F
MPLMLPTVLKNLFTGYATRLYPVQVREPFDKARGHITFNDDKCILCGACALRCPSVAIDIEKEKKELTFYPFRCIVCEVCVHICPTDAIDLIYKWRASAYEKNVEVHQARGKKKGKEAKEGADAKTE